ncbi:MAG: adenosylcobinamide-GDP ribazoletransferase [Methylococcales bacterium]|nr:adenosylcobinamide-GDP ribazoletransferase [Methylococcales bacterium]
MFILKNIKLAISFYTRIPIATTALDYNQLPQAAIYLPVIGWLVGGGVAVAFYVSALLWSKVTAIIIALITGILLTGGLHEDGFADVCDGFGGGYDKARVLAIMKDSHIGVYGVLGLLLLLALKISVLAELPTASLPLILLAGHSVSRFMPLLVMHFYDYARSDDSKVAAAVYTPNRKELLVAAVCACLPLLLLPALCSLAVLIVLLVNHWLGRYFYRHIGGYTGDCLGASQQVADLIFYLTVSSLWIFI